MFIDPDGRQNVSASQRQHDCALYWKFDQNTTLYGSSWFENSYEMAGFGGNFKTMWNGGDHGGSGSIAFGKTSAYRDLLLALQNGGDFSLKTKNGYMSWWTGGALGDANTAQEMIVHMLDLNRSSVPEIRQSYYNFNPYRQDNSLDWYSSGGRANLGLATAAIGFEALSGSARVTTQGQYIKFYLPKANGYVFQGNQYVKTIGLSKVAQGIGVASFWLGFAMDMKAS